jgi:hypothetical protein
MIAQQPSISLPQPHSDPIDSVEPLSLNRVVAALQVVLATRRAAFRDEGKHWPTLARARQK